MLEVVPYELSDIKNELKRKAIEEFGLSDAEYEGSNISQLINLLSYSNVINNTNFTFGLNEMFISQAQDRRNVIKHARQMGYSYKRRVSFQYKIKLKVLKSGEVTLNKYSNFGSNGNNYIYLGESILDVYGTYSYIKLLTNEYNNNVKDVYLTDGISKDKLLITEEGQVCKILHKEPVGDPRLLLEVFDGNELQVLSQLGQDIYITDEGNTRSNGYRNFVNVGIIDTFITDISSETFRLQMTLNNDITFPMAISDTHPDEAIVATEGGFKLPTDTLYPLNAVEELILVDGAEEITLSLLSLDIQDRNIIIPGDDVNAEEEYTGINNNTPYYLQVQDNTTHECIITTAHTMIENSLIGVEINFEGKQYTLEPNLLTINGNDITIPAQIENIVDTGLVVDANDEAILSHDTAKIINSIIVVDNEGNKTNLLESDYSYTNSKITITKVENTDAGNNPIPWSNFTVEADYDYYVKIEQGITTIQYSYLKNISGLVAKMKYNYIKDNDGYLAKRIFFSDYRGYNKDNENDYDALNTPQGWNGFYASDFNAETNVLYFDIGLATQEEIDSGRTAGNKFHNSYVSINGEEAERIDKVLITPFKKTRFSTTNEIKDPATQEVIGYEAYDDSKTFASVISTDVKNELEIIVKEGSLKRWNKETEGSIDARQDASDRNITLPSPIYEYPELTISINQDMINEGHFTVQNESIENDGIELFITRVLEDGSIEYDIPWKRRDYLLAEKTEIGDKSFVALSDVDYEDYINIHTKYAGTGTPLSLDMIAKINVLTSKGPDGNTNNLIDPIDNENFEAMYYLEETLTPSVLHIEGSDVQSTDDIRETAPLFSNTANRAVTKNDYKTICEAQQFIQSAQIWGGEEETPKNIPGHIFFSFIPYSRPITYQKDGTKYSLKNVDNSELFFASYYQITGKNRYDLSANTTDQNVVFNLLDNYKIITLQLNYIKPIYMDCKVDVKVLKYKFGQTIEETNAEIFENVKQYFVREIEQFDATYYESSMLRYMDEKIGDDYGLLADTSFSVDLYDSLYEPDKGTFINATKLDLTDDDNIKGLIGDNDDWKFIMPLDMPIEDLFEESTIVNNIVTRRGRMYIDNITNINTEGFITVSDFLYMELNDGTFISHDANGNLEDILANAYSEVIEINIMYTRNKADENAEQFKVGSYFIHRTQKIIRLELNTHTYWHIDSQAVVTEDMVNNGDFNSGNLGELLFYEVDPSTGDYILIDDEKVKTLNEKEGESPTYNNEIMPYTDTLNGIMLTDSENMDLYEIKICPLPREYFIERPRTMNINPKEGNIKSRRNVFSRFKSIEFTS